MQFRFTHLSGALQGHMDTVEATPILIGRDDGCHVKLDKLKDLAASAQHAQIDMVREGVYRVANLSRNGTFVNGALVEEARELPNHAVLQLGRDGPRLRFDVDENVAGISFHAEKEKAKTSKLSRDRLGPPPDTEERPAFKIEDAVDTQAKRGLDDLPLPLWAIVLIVAVVLIGGVVIAVLRH